jgi:hypothetical protein
MAYGTIKVDTITFTNGGADQNVTVSGLVYSTSGDLTITGTISGGKVNAFFGNFTSLTGTTVSGTNANFQTVSGISGVFTTSLSGTAITGNTAGFTTITGTTVTGATANFISGVFTTQLSGTTVTGNTGQFNAITGNTAGFTTVTGTTVTGTTANFTSGNFTNISGGTHIITSGVFALGTAAAPSISFTSDPNTGIFSPGADQVAISTSGTGRLTIDSNGNINIDSGTAYVDAVNNRLGIGTTSPGELLHVYNSAATSRLIVGPNGTGAATPNALALEQDNTGHTVAHVRNIYNNAGLAELRLGGYGFSTFTSGSSQTERARIDSSGRLLVGTTSASGNNLLQVNSDALIYSLTVGRGAGAISTNTAVGYNALAANTTGDYNTANGYEALYTNTIGIQNTANGYRALYANTTGIYNTANGYAALRFNTTGSSNTANGYAALFSNTTGNYNTATGFQALVYNTTGVQNTANGYEALYSNTTGNNNTANGYQALLNNTTGYYNTANGYAALYYNTTGIENTATGLEALRANTTGSYNTANGLNALYSNTTGIQNTAIGRAALVSNTTGINNTAIGTNILLFNTTGTNNTATGLEALRANTTGSYNTANGFQTLYYNTTGINNIAIGYYALYSNTTGAGNVCIGSVNSAGTYTPAYNITTENNRVVMGSTSVTNAYIQVAWTVVSDARDKTNFGIVPHGLDFVKQLNPISFQFKENRDATEPHGPVRYGFKAQDILALEGEDNAVIIDNEDPEKLRYNGEALVPVLVNAIKEQQSIIEQQQVQINALLARLDAAGI